MFSSTFQLLRPCLAGLSFLSLVVYLSACSKSSDGKSSKDRMGVASTSDSELGPFVSQGLDREQLSDREVLRAQSRVPRHEFVPADLKESAYEDRALPIGQGQTSSQPYIVALMTQEARVSSGAKVLEIGTGSGYQAAVLAELGATVFSI